MKTIIIPTSDIVREFRTYDHLFSFLEGGVKEVVSEAAIESSFSRRQRGQRELLRAEPYMAFYGTSSHHMLYSSPLTQRMIRTYFDFAKDGFSINDPLSHEHSVNVGVIEVISNNVEEAIHELIRALTGTPRFEVEIAPRSWVGNDLVINVSKPLPRQPYD